MRLPALVRTAVVTAVVTAVAVAAPAAPASADPGMTSDSFFGYNVGAVPRGTMLNQVSAVWEVVAPSDWSSDFQAAMPFVSLGGGCVTYDCQVKDDTVLMVGTESTIDYQGTITYRAWFRSSSLDLTEVDLLMNAGDRIRGTVERVAGIPGVWRLTLKNLTNGRTWTTTTPGPSLLASARWGVEPWVETDAYGQGYSRLPVLAPIRFDNLTLNGSNPRLRPEERVVFVPALTDEVVGTPSLPQPDGNGFAACSRATTCAVPANL